MVVMITAGAFDFGVGMPLIGAFGIFPIPEFIGVSIGIFGVGEFAFESEHLV